MSRAAALAAAAAHFDSGSFWADLSRRVAIPSTAQEPGHRDALEAYLRSEIGPTVERLGYAWDYFDNPVPGGGPLLIAERIEGADCPTVLTYGHGDVVRGQEGRWRKGLDPWHLVRDGDRIYGRGTADNKGQHSINLAALAQVLGVRGKLGFNSKILLDMSEEIGSPGLREFAVRHRARLAADVLVASDGPRLVPDVPTLVLGTRGVMNFQLKVDLRPGAHHSGNWGGVIANAGTRLSHAIACLVGPKGEVLVSQLRPPAVPDTVRTALRSCRVEAGPDGPVVEPDWGEPNLTPAERLFGWNSLEILAIEVGDPAQVVNAIPPRATAWCQIRFTVDLDADTFLSAIRRHLDDHGFTDVACGPTPGEETYMRATRLSPDNAWALWAAKSIESTVGRPPMVLPNAGGSLPNDIFAEVIGMPTLWVPHSYTGCSQHAPDEHLLAPLVRQGLEIMTGIFWDLGEPGTPIRNERQRCSPAGGSL